MSTFSSRVFFNITLNFSCVQETNSIRCDFVPISPAYADHVPLQLLLVSSFSVHIHVPSVFKFNSIVEFFQIPRTSLGRAQFERSGMGTSPFWRSNANCASSEFSNSFQSLRRFGASLRKIRCASLSNFSISFADLTSQSFKYVERSGTLWSSSSAHPGFLCECE